MRTDAEASSAFVQQLRHGLQGEQLRRALQDIRAGWQHRELWGTLGLHEVRQRYRRSTLGPFWITLSMGIMVFALGILYGQIFGQVLNEYMPFLAAGFVIWGLISAVILGGCQTFIAAEGMIRQLNAPLSIYAYREVWTALIAYGHNILVFIVVALWYGITPTVHSLWVVPATLLVVVNGFWMVLFLGLLSARFRDVPLIIASVVQVLFFLTPVIWQPTMLPDRAILLELNPFYHLVEIMRGPLLGLAPSWNNWFPVILMAVFGWVITLIFYSAYRWRIAYWV
jgi:ABC-2 type transport system permease protein/lipopolysaccharide transport system permease protein